MSESFEIERKYEAPAGAALPGALEFEALGLRAGAPEQHELAADYFDTPDGALARLRLAMRRREGGKDAGWHLKEKGAGGTRELGWTLSQQPPEGLRAELRRRIGDAADEVVRIAALRTTRITVQLRDLDGREAVELADDRVTAFDRASGVRRAWHEWEAELAPGADPALLERIEPLLVATGAEPSLSTAKIARATGRLLELASARGASDSIMRSLAALDAADREAGARSAVEFDEA